MRQRILPELLIEHASALLQQRSHVGEIVFVVETERIHQDVDSELICGHALSISTWKALKEIGAPIVTGKRTQEVIPRVQDGRHLFAQSDTFHMALEGNTSGNTPQQKECTIQHVALWHPGQGVSREDPSQLSSDAHIERRGLQARAVVNEENPATSEPGLQTASIRL